MNTRTIAFFVHEEKTATITNAITQLCMLVCMIEHLRSNSKLLGSAALPLLCQERVLLWRHNSRGFSHTEIGRIRFYICNECFLYIDMCMYIYIYVHRCEYVRTLACKYVH